MANKKTDNNAAVNEALLKEALLETESLLETAGAKPAVEINKSRKEAFGLRPSYVYNGIYYRAEGTIIDDFPVIILYATRDPAIARIGAEDSIAAFRADLPPRRLEKEVRSALKIGT